MKRNGILLNRKFRSYLIPMFATAIAVSLDEFVDSILVSNLLGAEAMALVNLGSPIMLIFSTIYYLFGLGGSLVYAVCIGDCQTEKAGKVFNLSLLMGLIFAFALFVFGICDPTSVCRLLCRDETLLPELVPYVRVLLYSAPLVIGVQIISMFLPAAGMPKLSGALCMMANIINLIGDWVYIKYFNVGLPGAAWATFTGYCLCLVVLIIMVIFSKVRIYASMISFADFAMLGNIITMGASGAITQLCFAFKGTFFNSLSLSLGGAVCLQVYTLCAQIISIMSIGLMGVFESTRPMIATLYGQKDHAGVSFVMKQALLYLTVIQLSLVVLFEAFPVLLYKMFNIEDPQVIEMANSAVRIFLLLYVVRGYYMLFVAYARVSGHKLYAVVISLLDGIVLPVLFALMLTSLMGVDGIWLSFAISGFVLFTGIAVYNARASRSSDNIFQKFFMLERPLENEAVYDITVSEDNENITELSKGIAEFCTSHGVTEASADKIGLLAEELAVYTRLHRSKDDRIDVLARIEQGCVTVNFRSEGTPFNPLAESESDTPENILILRKMPSSILYDYVMGMNNTRFTVKY